MTIEKVIEWLKSIEVIHGNVEVYFDCPHCGKTTQPTTAVVAAMLKEVKSE